MNTDEHLEYYLFAMALAVMAVVAVLAVAKWMGT